MLSEDPSPRGVTLDRGTRRANGGSMGAGTAVDGPRATASSRRARRSGRRGGGAGVAAGDASIDGGGAGVGAGAGDDDGDGGGGDAL